jgi:hypothetical protein
VAKNWPGTHEAEEAQRFAQALEDPQAVAFYKELYAYSPTKVTLPPLGSQSIPSPESSWPAGQSRSPRGRLWPPYGPASSRTARAPTRAESTGRAPSPADVLHAGRSQGGPSGRCFCAPQASISSRDSQGESAWLTRRNVKGDPLFLSDPGNL